MYRVSTDIPFTDSSYFMRQKESSLSNIQNQLDSGTRLNNLSNDPLAAARSVRYESYLNRLNRFEQNTQYARDHYNNTYDYLNEAMPILQRMRELSVQGANGTYSPEDLRIMAIEVNELLKELVSISNAMGPDTKKAFSGDKVHTEPFRIVEGTVDGGQETLITRVEYRGSGATRRAEIGDNMFIDLDLGGDEAFWAEKMLILSTVDATDYRVQAQGSFYIDGVEIQANVGDTLPSLVAKINDSAAPVKAYIDPQTRGLVLEGTSAHLVRAEDKEGGAAILRDLGIINGNMVNNAPNWNSSARVYGGSIFDMAIRMRDGMLRGDSEFLGSQGIAGMDLSIKNLAERIAVVGSRQERAEMAWNRINREIPNVTAMFDREAGVNMETKIMELHMAQTAHQASLQIAARLLPQTLLDFLR
jgi:flagellar hook-associated protein 3 FlgL